MGKTVVTKSYVNGSILGIATLTDTQIENLNRVSTRLSLDLIYVIPRQWVHSEKLNTPINGNDRSNKVFAFGFTESGDLKEVVTLSINGLRDRHYGVIKDTPNLKLPVVKNDNGLWRLEPGTSSFSVFSDGSSVPFKTEGNKVYVSEDFSFKVLSRNNCYAVTFQRTAPNANTWDIIHVTDDGNEIAKLSSRAYNDYVKVPNQFNTDWDKVAEVDAEIFNVNV